jgi:ubiquinone/menaquinone biosynthesis C-methylase UbiE
MNNTEYYKYLTRRTIKAKIYRNYFLYPILSKHLNGKVLDVGCGIGDFISFRKNTIGVDVNELLVKFNMEKGRKVFLIEPAGKLPFKNEHFDSILLDNVLEHIDDPKSLLNEIYRLLKPKGILLVGVPGEKGFKSDKDHKIYYDQTKLIDFFQKKDFISNKIFHIPFRSKFLNKKLRIYCTYCKFIKI